MEDEMKERLTSRDLWTRALYMVLFVIAYSVAEIVLTLLVVFQFFAILFTGNANTSLLKLGHNLSAYIYQILQFETFNTEQKPFPFSDWPDDTPEENRWVGGSEPSPAEPTADTASALDSPAADEENLPHDDAPATDDPLPPEQTPPRT